MIDTYEQVRIYTISFSVKGIITFMPDKNILATKISKPPRSPLLKNERRY
jgi:hypothetical protein